MMELKNAVVTGDIILKLSKAENLELRKVLNACKKYESAEIKLNSGNYFLPSVLERVEE
ncbi:hypothetical protein [Lactococcus petauri]|uniref:hypothetical protein n=1 Tax=Lactococcus petauri TaxID=1940789 RepID=UPI00255057BD|nr:hypothetical protein [Lactococcus petauri]